MIKSYTPSLIIENISKKAVRLLGLATIEPGQTLDVYKTVEPTELFEDQIIKALEAPWGDLYNEVVLKKTLVIHSLVLSSYFYSKVSPLNFTAVNAYTPGSVPAVFDDDRFEWVTPFFSGVAEPLSLVGGVISISKAGETTDGYLTKEDWSLFSSAIRPAIRIWQYQDFIEPVSDSLSISEFQNGTDLPFNSSYIIDGTAQIVLAANTSRPPTTVITFPGNLYPGNRVVVQNHIGTTAILNQEPHSSLACRLFYLVEVPAGVPLPSGYQEDPQFLNDASNDYLDEHYVNQNRDEYIFGQKTFDSIALFNNSIQIPVGAVNGFVLKSDEFGNATWQEETGGGDGYGGVSDHSALDGLELDDHLQYLHLSSGSMRNQVTGSVDFSDGYLVLPKTTDLSLIADPDTGQISYSEADGYIVFFDGYEWKNVGTGTIADSLFILSGSILSPIDPSYSLQINNLYLNSTAIEIYEDSGNLMFKDTTGVTSLTALKSMRNIWIKTGSLSPGNYTLSDATTWDTRYSHISHVLVTTTSLNWDLDIFEDSSFDMGSVGSRGLASAGVGSMVVPVTQDYNSDSNNVYLAFTDHTTGLTTASFYIFAEARRH